MNRFIIPDLPGVEKKVGSDIQTIVNSLRADLKSNLLAVLLCGGFGRGEGSVIEIDGKIRPYNDYDFVLITKRYIPKSRLDALGKKLAREVGIRFVDLGALRETTLAKLSNSIFVCDLQGSRVVYGDQGVMKNIPHVNPEEIGLDEARLLLRNRLICFLELTPDEWFLGQPLAPEQHREMVLQTSKAMIAAVISVLLRRHLYHSSYRQQLNNFLALDQPAAIRDLARAAYEIKIGIKDPLSVQTADFWMQARSFFLQTYSASVGAGLTISEQVQRFNAISIAKRIVKRVAYGEATVPERTKRRVEHLTLLALQSFQAFMRLDETKGTECSKQMREWFASAVAPGDWNAMKRVCSDLWQRYHH